MVTLEQKYNQPPNYTEVINNQINEVVPELSPYMDSIGIIFAGIMSGFMITERKTEDIIQQIVDYRSRGKNIIMFENMSEGVVEAIVEKANEVATLALSLYPDLKFFYITASQYGQKDVDQHFARIKVQSVLSVISVATFEYYHDRRAMGLEPKEYLVGPRGKIFCCLNRILRFHRAILLDKLLSKSLVDDNCYYSFHNSALPDGGIDNLFQYPKHLFPNIVENIELVKALRLNWDPDRINPNDIRLQDHELYNNSYFSIIPETNFYDKEFIIKKYGGYGESYIGIFFSEKIYKPMTMLHPFIIAAAPYALKALRSRGFKTFHPYIDETYDTITDDDKRLDAIVDEAERLSSQTPEQWDEWCRNIKPIVEHNQQQLVKNSNYLINPEILNLL